tara:strand:+ start:1006 stop:1554 length:549 start_codon:yes stop_codon:yes gene_type:complete
MITDKELIKIIIKERKQMKTIDRTQAKELINKSNGRIFSATFTKKDFTSRLINARLGVKYERKTDRKRPYDPSKKDLIAVFDMIKKQHRTINLRTLDSLSINKNKYIISRKKENDYSTSLDKESSIELTINNIKIVIKHNDIGYSIDTYMIMPLDDVLIRDEQVFFDDLEEVITNDVKQIDN